jgi:hypothetical protein
MLRSNSGIEWIFSGLPRKGLWLNVYELALHDREIPIYAINERWFFAMMYLAKFARALRSRDFLCYRYPFPSNIKMMV